MGRAATIERTEVFDPQARVAAIEGRLDTIEAQLSEAPSGFLPIASAPRDGRAVLLFDIEEADHVDPVVCAWENGRWIVSWSGEQYIGPTHWAPLPTY